MTTPSRKVLLAGATGLIGGYLLQRLLADASVGEVHVLVRRPFEHSNPKLHTHWVDFTRLPDLPPLDEVYLALGTTLKVAGSQAGFRAVDFDANLAVAHAAQRAGAKRLGLVSAVGANAKSSIFYNRVKGELEDAIKGMAWPSLVIAQPSLLLDHRGHLGQTFRIAETIAISVGRLIAPLVPGAYRPVYGETVAQALLEAVPVGQGVRVLQAGTNW